MAVNILHLGIVEDQFYLWGEKTPNGSSETLRKHRRKSRLSLPVLPFGAAVTDITSSLKAANVNHSLEFIRKPISKCIRMNLCKDNTNCISWRISVCTPNRGVRVGVFLMGFGPECNLFYPNTANLLLGDGHGQICERSPTAFFTSCEPVANGKPRRVSLLPAVHCTTTFRNGHDATFSINSGNICCDSMMNSRASNGSGKVSTDRPPRRPWAGKKTGKNPTDRGKLGVKRSVLTDGRGVPLGVAIAGANVHDQKLFHATLSSLPIRRPRPTARRPQHLCCDKGYDAAIIHREARRRRYIPHIKSRGEEQIAKRIRGRRARRWVVERIASWMNRFRRIFIRWEKKAINYEALIHWTLAYITWKQIRVFG
jgi:putative transposase